jgi:hypothetical protein
MAAFRAEELGAAEGTQRLGLSRARFYKLYSSYLAACAHHREGLWKPGVSGGDHAAAWPPEVHTLLTKRLSSKPAASYSFAASEVLRKCQFKLDRAQVRRWAIENNLAHPRPAPVPTAPIRRWQRSRIGELWQLDATPHRWFPGCPQLFPLLNMLDDCSRLFTGSKIYERETLLAYLDFLPAAFIQYGMPLEIYVDYHSLFFSTVPEALTQLGWALHFYGISFRYAPTARAKGKIERAHQLWQERLPAYFASEQISDIDQANTHLHQLRQHRNQQEIHRELQMKPSQAWELAKKEKRSVLRPVPSCPWWHFVWSIRTSIKVGSDGRVPIGTQRLRVEATPGSRVILCHHTTGHHSVLAQSPSPKHKPLILFSTFPQKHPVSF